MRWYPDTCSSPPRQGSCSFFVSDTTGKCLVVENLCEAHKKFALLGKSALVLAENRGNEVII